MSWFESTFAAALPGAQLLLLVLGLPILVFGLVKLLVLPLSVWFEIRAAGRRRREVPTLRDEWPSVSIIVPAYNEATVIENCVRSIQLTRYDLRGDPRGRRLHRQHGRADGARRR